MTKIMDSCGNWVEDPVGVRRSFNDQFRKLFCFSGNCALVNLLDCIIPSISIEMNAALTCPIDEVKIRTTTF
ncbi:hypothetical protein EV2_022745 [Malus domestica]